MIQLLGASGAHEMCQLFHWHEVRNIYIDMDDIIMYRRFAANSLKYSRVLYYVCTVASEFVRDMYTF